jgi:hypothetical protein
MVTRKHFNIVTRTLHVMCTRFGENVRKLDVRQTCLWINYIEINNKVQLFTRIHRFHCLLTAQHASSNTPPIIRSSKNVTAAPGLTHVRGHRSLTDRRPRTCVRPGAAVTIFELLMMGGLPIEACWAINNHWNGEFWWTVASFWLFLYNLYYDARIHDTSSVYGSWAFLHFLCV